MEEKLFQILSQGPSKIYLRRKLITGESEHFKMTSKRGDYRPNFLQNLFKCLTQNPKKHVSLPNSNGKSLDPSKYKTSPNWVRFQISNSILNTEQVRFSPIIRVNLTMKGIIMVLGDTSWTMDPFTKDKSLTIKWTAMVDLYMRMETSLKATLQITREMVQVDTSLIVQVWLTRVSGLMIDLCNLRMRKVTIQQGIVMYLQDRAWLQLRVLRKAQSDLRTKDSPMFNSQTKTRGISKIHMCPL